MKFAIPIAPHGQMRPRFMSKGKFRKAYKDGKQEDREEKLLVFLKEHAPMEPWTGNIKLFVKCYMQRPKNHFGTGKNAGKLKSWAPEWHTSKPDADNLLKMLKDCMNELFYVDDKQVCWTDMQKIYTAPGGRARWEVEITEIL